MRNKIEDIEQEMSGSGQKRQDYIIFSEKQRQTILEASKKVGMSKSMTIAVACRFLVESLAEADKSEAKKDGK